MIKVDPTKCGMGMENDCCAYLICGPNGFECGREVSESFVLMIKERVLGGSMNAIRLPEEPYPECQVA
jgi:hypothetical protein